MKQKFEMFKRKYKKVSSDVCIMVLNLSLMSDATTLRKLYESIGDNFHYTFYKYIGYGWLTCAILTAFLIGTKLTERDE